MSLMRNSYGDFERELNELAIQLRVDKPTTVVVAVVVIHWLTRWQISSPHNVRVSFNIMIPVLMLLCYSRNSSVTISRVATCTASQ